MAAMAMTEHPAPIVTFLSDFGTSDIFVGLCHGVIAGIAPHVNVIDLTHAVPAQDIVTGARRLQDCVAHLPDAVHLAVVDPGVGTARPPVMLRSGSAWLVGPDNGLLMPAARTLGGVLGAWVITPDPRQPSQSSMTFHGRDIFAPAAAQLAAGVSAETLGTRLDPTKLVSLHEPAPTLQPGTLLTHVRDVDQFGNVQLVARRDDLKKSDLDSARILKLVADNTTVTLQRADTFANLGNKTDALGLLVDSFGWLAVVRNQADAAEWLSLQSGDQVRLELERLELEKE